MSGVEIGDTVRLLDVDGWANSLALVEGIDDVPSAPADKILTLETCPGGRTYRLLSEVERVDMPRVAPGQVWACDEPAATVRVREVSWMTPMAWETDTLTPAGRYVGTVILAHPAWRLVDDPGQRGS